MNGHVGPQEEGTARRWRDAMQTCRSILTTNEALRSKFGIRNKKNGKNNVLKYGGNVSNARKRVVQELLRDLAAVVTGLRTGVLLSHIHDEAFGCAIQHCIQVMWDAMQQQEAEEEEAEKKKKQVQGTPPPPPQPQQQLGGNMCKTKDQEHIILLLTSLVDEGSLLVVSLTALKHTPYPKGVVFCNTATGKLEGLIEPAWADYSEQEALEQCFGSIHDALMAEQVATMLPEREHLANRGLTTGAMVLDSCLSRHGILLGENGYPSIPTLYGWMLGYPVTYVIVGAEHAGRVSRSLSATTCVFYSVRTRMQSIYLDDNGDDDQPNQEEVMAFSVPQALVLQEEKQGDAMCVEHLSAWKQRLSCQHTCWAPPACDTFSAMTGILI